MQTEFTHNHYVPEWYQRRFMLPGQTKYHYLDLRPDRVTNKDGFTYTRRNLLNWGPVRCFAHDDLYTVQWGNWKNVDIEKFFFGRIDSEGREAVEYFADYDQESADGKALENLLTFMSVQRLRTPKGLGTLAETAKTGHRNLDLIVLQRIQNVFCATWTECVWQIADASTSPTKFIISDHPVTVYNRGCFPISKYCTGFNDPDIRWAGTHTYLPLSLDKILILTNLSWVRNPYQSETKVRPNPGLFRNTIFNFMSIQTGRHLREDEVRRINYITKRRAHRYVAAAEKEWVFPEASLKTEHWRKLDDGYLFMPDPRNTHMGGEVLIRYESGRADAFSEYGHKPWQQGYKDAEREKKEGKTLSRFQAEFARMHGPEWRGCDMEFMRKGPRTDSPEMHEHYLQRAEAYRQAEKRKR